MTTQQMNNVYQDLDRKRGEAASLGAQVAWCNVKLAAWVRSLQGSPSALEQRRRELEAKRIQLLAECRELRASLPPRYI